MDEKEQLTTDEIQQRVHRYISQFKEGYFSPLSLTARLTEEVGELAREIQHTYGDKPKKKDEEASAIEDEVGDILFVLACLANSLEFELSDAFERSISKIETRDKDRWTR